MTAKLKVEMFGWLRAITGEAVITRFRTRKTGVLFGYLAYHSERNHPRELLADLLWPEAQGATGRNSLSQALSSLRAELGRSGAVPIDEMLAADRNTVQLFGNTDVAEFQSALATDGGADGRLGGLRRAVSLYSGELLPGHYDDWILVERSRLRDLFLKANHELVTLLRKVGDLRGAIETAHRAAGEDPLSEEAIRDLMQAHADASEPHMALRVYNELEVNLAREVGERPSLPTRNLARDIAASRGDVAADPVLTRPDLATTSLLIQMGRAAGPFPAVWAGALSAARSTVKSRAGSLGGRVVRDEPSRIVAGFAHPVDGLDCAVQLRDDLRRLSWPDGQRFDIRIGLDTVFNSRRREATSTPTDAVLRLSDSLLPGEIVLSEATASLVRRDLEPGMHIAELGRGHAAAGSEHLYRIELDAVALVPRATGS